MILPFVTLPEAPPSSEIEMGRRCAYYYSLILLGDGEKKGQVQYPTK